MKRVHTNRSGRSSPDGNPSPTVRSPASPDAARRQRLQLVAVCILLATAILFVFRQTTEFDFVNYDDDANVYANPSVNRGLTPASVAWAFTHTQVGHWIPVTTLSHMLDCQAYGLNAGGHHLTNVILHTASAILLFLVLRRMTAALWPSAFVAALFAVHPLRVESVAWVTERKDVLSGLFFFLTIAAYVGYARSPASLRRYLLVMLMFALGLMSKSMLVTLPFLLLLLDYWPLGRFADPPGGTPGPGARDPGARWNGSLRLIAEKLPLLALSAIASAITFRSASQGIVALEILPLSVRIGNALASYVAYIGQMVYPADLAVFYPHQAGRLPLGQIAAAGAVLIGISATAIAMRRSRPWLLTGWLWYLGMLVPVIGIVQSGELARADRYTYLPQIGLYVAIAWTAADLARRIPKARGLIAVIGIAVVPVLAVCARTQAGYWKDGETLWKRALSCTPANAIAHHNLGAALAKQGRFDEALDHFRAALDLRPRYGDALNNLGNLLAQHGRAAEAIDHFQEALRLSPDNERLNRNLGNAFLLAGRADEAIQAFKKSLANAPDSAETHTNIALALEQARNPREAIVHYQKSLELAPTTRTPYLNLAWLLATSTDASLRDGRRAVELAERSLPLSKADDPWILDVLAAAYAETGRFREAIETAERAIRMAAAKDDVATMEAIRKRVLLYRNGSPFHDATNTGKRFEGER